LRPVFLFYLVQQVRRRTRTFREELTLPPLRPIDGATSDYATPIPVLYTNDPDAASEWIEQHICERPMIVGWDTEVSEKRLIGRAF
jgi:hypothetical protein